MMDRGAPVTVYDVLFPVMFFGVRGLPVTAAMAAALGHKRAAKIILGGLAIFPVGTPACGSP